MVKYTREKPTAPGYYWFRHTDSSGEVAQEAVVEVMENPYTQKDGIEFRMFITGWECPVSLDVEELPGGGTGEYYEWAGPLEKPEAA